MTALSKMAHVTHRGKDVPLEDETPQYRAWLVHTSLREEAERRNMDRLAAKDGTPGWKYIGSVNRHLTSLFPEYDQTSDPEARQAFQRPVYAYLSATHNAECLVRGGGQTPPVWWVRDVWRDSGGDAGAGTPPVKDDAIVPDASPVQSTWKCSHCDERFPSTAALAGHVANVHKGPARCQRCDATFPDVLHLARHTAKDHPNLRDCPICGRTGIDPRGYHKHLDTHGRFACEVCGKRFPSKRSLNGHKVVHAGAPDPSVGGHSVTVLSVPLAVVPDPPAPPAPADLGAMLTALVTAEVEKRLAEYAAGYDEMKRRAEEAEARLAEMRKLLGG